MNAAPRAPLIGAGYLLLASTLWGAAFIPQAISVEDMGPWWATALRFLIAAPFACLIAGRRLARPGVNVGPVLVLGVVLFVAFYLQTAALKLTPVWRVSLLTGTYAAFTPLLAPFFGYARPTRLHGLGVLCALTGLFLLTGALAADGVQDAAPLNLGDLMTLGHALLTAVHLLLIGRLVHAASPRALNAWQLVVMMVCALLAASFLEAPPTLVVFDRRTLFAFAYLAVFSSTIAFSAQIAGQKTASPTAAALIMLLEAPIGAALAVWLLDEQVSMHQGIGALFLMLGVSFAVAADLRRARPADTKQQSANQEP